MIDLTALEERTVEPVPAAAAHAPGAGRSGAGSGTMGAERSGRGAGGDDTPFWLRDVKPPLIREPSPVLGNPRTDPVAAEPAVAAAIRLVEGAGLQVLDEAGDVAEPGKRRALGGVRAIDST